MSWGKCLEGSSKIEKVVLQANYGYQIAALLEGC